MNTNKMSEPLQTEMFNPQMKDVVLGNGITLRIPITSRMGKNDRLVFEVLSDGAWHSIDQISNDTEIKITSASSHVRDLRKDRCGGFDVDSQQREGVTYYRVNRLDDGSFSRGCGYFQVNPKYKDIEYHPNHYATGG